jgi:proteasome lid subunit RPN8/RPN11
VYTLHLQPEHDRAIREHGQRAYPNECCGFLLGRLKGDVQEVVQVMPARNEHGEEEQFHRFTITPAASYRAEKAARAEGLDVLGHYHSHPDAQARPSSGFPDGDLENATWPGYAFAIVSVGDGKAQDLTSWLLAEDRSKFDSQVIKIGDL